MSLMNIIKDYINLTPAEIIPIITAQNISITTNRKFNYKKIIAVYSLSFLENILTRLKTASGTSPDIDYFYVSILGEGLDYSAQENRAMMTTFVSSTVFTQNIMDKLIALNSKLISLVERDNIADYSEAAIQAAINEYNSRVQEEKNIRNRIEWWTNLHNLIIPQIEAGQLTKAKAKTIVAGS